MTVENDNRQTSLTPADLEAIRSIVRDELARVMRTFAHGIGAPVEGDDRCDEKTKQESVPMDLTSTETNGASSLRRRVHSELQLLRQSAKRTSSSSSGATKQTAER
ncbi:MAG TPA: hypothetical protein VMJ10_22290 [Kofleriaceae bacterium]|nr:hypothetical protein [Kofleriaceae bacterium]